MSPVPILPVTIDSTPTPPYAFSENVAANHPPTVNIVHGSHNFRRPNRAIAEYDDDIAARLATLVERRATAADPDLIRLIVDMLDPPSTHMVKMSRLLVSTPQSLSVAKILKHKVNRYYNTKRSLAKLRSAFRANLLELDCCS